MTSGEKKIVAHYIKYRKIHGFQVSFCRAVARIVHMHRSEKERLSAVAAHALETAGDAPRR